MLDLEQKEGAGKVGGVEAGWGKRGWQGRQAVEQMSAELMTSFTQRQSHRCLCYSLEQEAGGKENRNNIKLEPSLTHTSTVQHCRTRH